MASAEPSSSATSKHGRREASARRDAVMVETFRTPAALRTQRPLRGGGERSSVGGQTVGAEETLHVRRGRVARLAGVDDGDPAAGASEHERGGEAGGTAADHDHVVVAAVVIDARGPAVVAGGVHRLVHVIQRASCAGGRQRLLLILGNARWNGPWTPKIEAWRTSAIAAALDMVGPRLRRVRSGA